MHVTALVADLIFESKITATAKHVGVDVRIARTPADILNALSDASESQNGLGGLIVDLNVATGDALDLIRQIKADHPALPIVAYLSHVQVELADNARQAGADRVLPKSDFTARLPEILTDLREGRAPSAMA